MEETPHKTCSSFLCGKCRPQKKQQKTCVGLWEEQNRKLKIIEDHGIVEMYSPLAPPSSPTSNTVMLVNTMEANGASYPAHFVNSLSKLGTVIFKLLAFFVSLKSFCLLYNLWVRWNCVQWSNLEPLRLEADSPPPSLFSLVYQCCLPNYTWWPFLGKLSYVLTYVLTFGKCSWNWYLTIWSADSESLCWVIKEKG